MCRWRGNLLNVGAHYSLGTIRTRLKILSLEEFVRSLVLTLITDASHSSHPRLWRLSTYDGPLSYRVKRLHSHLLIICLDHLHLPFIPSHNYPINPPAPLIRCVLIDLPKGYIPTFILCRTSAADDLSHRQLASAYCLFPDG